MSKENYKICNLYAENIKKLKIADITPGDNVVILEGKNKQGKTSTLDSIAYALGGTKMLPQKPVREGEENAIIKIDIGDYVITRKWTTPDKSTLKVETKNGMKPQKPQNFIDDLMGNLAFDPLEFLNMDKKKRIEVVKSITGLNFDDLEEKHTENYEARKNFNRDMKKIES